MSMHFEWTLSLWLRPDTPDEFVEELRYHLGQAATPPEVPTLGYEHAVFELSGPESLAGGPTSSLSLQKPYLNCPSALGLFVRTLVLDDEMYEIAETVAGWLARWSATEGWIGFAREETDLRPWLQFYVQDRRAYVAGPGESPRPVDQGSPPFTLRQTSLELTP